MALHHKTLESAFNKYSPLAMEGKSEGEIKEAIKADEKGFDEDAVNEIYAAIIKGDQKPKQEAPKAHIVISPFRDKDDFSKKYSIDDDVSHFDKERLQYCIEKGLVEKQ